jgi:glycosyltransferase involved in cell wall biosynthesis
MENELFGKGDYVIFMDSDDWFSSSDCLEEIAKALEVNNYPDLLRLSYYTLIDDRLSLCDLSDQQTVERIVADQNVACWTKCVKTEKLVPFPENTLMEDVVQHIKQMDNVETVASINKGIIVWNRNNRNSCSRDETLQNGKWKSSLYRYYADLLDLAVKNPACQAELERRRTVALDNIKNDRFVQ